MRTDSRLVVLRVIDVLTFDEERKNIDTKAYHGPGDADIVG